MKFSKPFFWRHGTFMEPEYLQYQDMYHQTVAARLASLGTPYPWGFSRLELNQEGLASGNIEIKRLEALLRDGTWLAVPENTVLLPRSFANDWQERGKPFNFYLGIKKLDAREPNAVVIETGKEIQYLDARYVSVFDQASEAQNIYEGGGDSQLETLSYVTKIFWESELEDKTNYMMLPLGRLVERNTEIMVDPFFIPPSLSLNTSDTVMRVMDFVIDDMASKVTRLEGYKRDSFLDKRQSDTPLMQRYRQILQVLARYLPLLKHLRNAPAMHPWELYGVLCQLIGELSVFSTHMDALGQRKDQSTLPNYNHLNAGVGYSAIYTRLRQLLGDLTIDPGLILDLNLNAQGIYEAEIPDTFFAEGREFYLVILTREAVSQWLDRFNRFAKVGTSHHVAEYVARSLPGLDLKYMTSRPSGIHYQDKATYFEVNRSDDIWRLIDQYHTIGMKWEDAPSDLQVQLIVVKN